MKQKIINSVASAYFIIDKDNNWVNTTTNQHVADIARECGFLVTQDSSLVH